MYNSVSLTHKEFDKMHAFYRDNIMSEQNNMATVMAPRLKPHKEEVKF